MDGTKPITPRERELLDMASIASQLPVEFATGACWLAFTADCKLCDRPIPPELLRGVVSRPMPSVATLEAVGVCPACRVATPFVYRMHDDGRFTGLRDNSWQTWRPPLPLWARFKRFLRWR